MEEGKYVTSDEYHEMECPHCGYKNDMMESLDDLVTLWGEESVQERECRGCEKIMFIKENVSRSWDIAKKEEDLD